MYKLHSLENMKFDMHNHTNASDGLLTPSELVQYAAKKGLYGIAITDHDTTDGISEAKEMGRKLGITIIPGIELNTQTEKEEIHILGYFIDTNLKWLQDILKNIREARYNRAEKIVNNLNHLYGFNLSFDDVKKHAEGGAIARPHIGRLLIEKGFVKDLHEAFDKYIGTHSPGYVSRFKLKPNDGIQLIKKAGGAAVLAHPGLINNLSIIDEIVALGIKGIEVYHTKHTLEQTLFFEDYAQKRGLIATGGSDCHGELIDGAPIVGNVHVDSSIVLKIEKAAERYK